MKYNKLIPLVLILIFGLNVYAQTNDTLKQKKAQAFRIELIKLESQAQIALANSFSLNAPVRQLLTVKSDSILDLINQYSVVSDLQRSQDLENQIKRQLAQARGIDTWSQTNLTKQLAHQPQNHSTNTVFTLPVAEDLLPTLDANSQAQSIVELANNLNNNPVEIYNFIRENIAFTPTSGSIQGAVTTLQTRIGNATDTASLMVATMRAAQIPTRYIQGRVTIDSARLKKWVADLDDINQVLSLFTQSGIQYTTVTSGGVVSAIEFDHTWVEIWVDMHPSNGVQNYSQNNDYKSWVALDASYKLIQFNQGINLAQSLSNLSSNINNQLNNALSYDATSANAQLLDRTIIDDINTTTKDQILQTLGEPLPTMSQVFGEQHQIPLNNRLLPASLPYATIGTLDKTSQLDAANRHLFELNIYANQNDVNANNPLLSYQQPMAQLAHQNLYIVTKAATAADAQRLADIFVNITDISSLANEFFTGNINVIIELSDDVGVIVQSNAIPLGSRLLTQLDYTNDQQQVNAQRFIITAGEIRTISWNLQGGLANRLNQISLDVSAQDPQSSNPQQFNRVFLTAANILYLGAVEIYDKWLAAINQVVYYQSPSFISSYSWIDSQTFFDVPTSIKLKGIAVNAVLNKYKASRSENNPKAIENFNEQSNRLESYLASYLLENIYTGQQLNASQFIVDALIRFENVLHLDSSNSNALSTIGIDTILQEQLQYKINQNHKITINSNTQGIQDYTGYGIFTDASDLKPVSNSIYGGTTNSTTHRSAALITNYGAAFFYQSITDIFIGSAWVAPQQSLLAISDGTLALINDPLAISLTPAIINIIVPTIVATIIPQNSYPQIISDYWLLSVLDGININSLIDPIPPVINLTLQPEQIELTQSSLITATATDDQGIAEFTVSIQGNIITLDANNQYTFTPTQPGRYNILAIARDTAGNISEQQKILQVLDPNDTTPPDIDILTPVDGSTATGIVDISIRVQDTDLSAWQLSYRDAADEAGVNAPRTILAQGTNPVNGTTVANWDTSQLRNGIYVLILEAIDANGQASSITNSLFIEGDLKIGNFQIAFEDLNIPVAGIPVTITRSYDTRNRNADEAFGKGWEIGYQSLQLTESRIPGLGWYRTTEYYNIGPVRLPRFCIESIGDRLVSVRMPDGTLEKFKVMAKTLNPTSDERSNCQDIVPSESFNVQFKPQGDTNSTLTSNDIAGNVKVINGNLQTLIGTQPIDPNKYTLTLQDGTKYSIDQGFNLTDIETTDGNSIKFTHNGIEHNNGYSVQFIRDSQDRIRFIQKPNGERIEYTYNANGDLTSHTDLMGNTTTFTYILDHYLEEINDPRGIMVARNEYDADGRLIAHVDAQGNRIEYTHDIQGRTETITDRNGNSSIFVYDNAGSVIAETNALGETTYHEYNDIYLETKRTDPLGHETLWTYDNFGNQLTETDALGHITTSTYNNRGEILTQTDDAGNAVITNEYGDQNNPFDGGGNLKKVTDALGNNTNFHWTVGQDSNLNTVVVNTGFTDAKGNRYDVTPLTSGTNNGLSGATTDLNGLKTESTYDSEARPLTQSQIITDTNGVEIARYTTTFTYNANGDIITTTDALGHVTSTEYNQLNKVSATIDADGNRTTYEFDDRGNPSKTTYPDGTFETTTYDAEGNAIASTDRAGRVTKTIYDAANRVVEVIMPDSTPSDNSDNPKVINAYDAAGRLTSITDENGNVTTYAFDAKGNNTSVTDPLGKMTQYLYDANNQRIESLDALNHTSKFVYDLNGNLTQTLMPDATPADDSDNPRITVTYDERNRKISETDLAGNTTQFVYDAGGNLIEVIDSLSQSTTYTFDQRGNKVSQTDANGHVTTWAYNELSQVISHTLPEGQSESFSYDAKGRLITHTDFNGDTSVNEYDVMNELIKTTYADGSIETFTYYPSGQTASITTAQGTINYVYDAQDRIITETKHNGDVLNYVYDLNGNKTQTNLSKGTLTKTWNYQFDALNRLSQVTDDQSRSYTIQYNAIGLREKIIQDNGIYVTYNYDEQNRLTSQSTFNSSDVLINSYNYALSPTGLRENIAENTGRNSAYVYDDLYRLTNETITDTINGNHTASYQYDAVGNRTASTINGVSTVYMYNANDQVLTAGAITYQYNANGSLIQENDDGTISNYSYNKKNELTQLTTAIDTYQYQYDPHGVRNQTIINGQTTEYLIDHNQTYAQVLVETTATAQTIYTYGDDLLAEENLTGIHYYQYDGLGSTRQLTDPVQTISDEYYYDAFGNLLAQTGTTENNYLFTGEQYDPNMGFYYLRARYMNPVIGRFVSMDTYAGSAGTPISLNKYVYANANPITYTDPSGHFGLAEQGVANSIRNILMEYQTSAGFTLLDIALDPDSAAGNVGIGILLGVASIGGKAMFKLAGIFSRKLRSLGCNSFAENTLISTEFGFKDIEEIQIGDKIWAFNEQENSITLQEVVHTIVGQAEKQTIDITLASGEIIQATDEHPIYAQSQGLWDWVEAKNLKQDMLLLDRGGQTLSILNITHNSKKVQVYNLTVANGHTYYVSKDEVLVHNAGGKSCPYAKFDWRHQEYGSRAGGIHYAPGGIPLNPNVYFTSYRRERAGYYEAYWKNRTNTKQPKLSTFFPENMSLEEMRTLTRTATLKHFMGFSTRDGRWFRVSLPGVLPPGVVIRIQKHITNGWHGHPLIE